MTKDNVDWKTSSEAWQKEAQKMHRRAQMAEGRAEKLAAALEEIRDAHPTGSSWSLMNDGTWREAARDFQRIARVTLSADGAEPR